MTEPSDIDDEELGRKIDEYDRKKREEIDQTVKEHLANFCNALPMLEIAPDPFNPRRVVFQYSREGINVQGSCTAMFPGYYLHEGNPYKIEVTEFDGDLAQLIRFWIIINFSEKPDATE